MAHTPPTRAALEQLLARNRLGIDPTELETLAQTFNRWLADAAALPNARGDAPATCPLPVADRPDLPCQPNSRSTYLAAAPLTFRDWFAVQRR